jgi:hypothetical protein
LAADAQNLDQIAQRFDPIDVDVAETQVIQPTLAAGTPDAVELRQHTFFPSV